MNKPEIHDDDYSALEYEHSNALRELENLSIGNFSYANDVLIKLQDNAYQLGLARGRKESGSIELLEALEAIINVGGQFVLNDQTHRAARAAIAKARGEQ